MNKLWSDSYQAITMCNISKETVKQYIRNQYTVKEQCQFFPQFIQQDSLARFSLDYFKVE